MEMRGRPPAPHINGYLSGNEMQQMGLHPIDMFYRHKNKIEKIGGFRYLPINCFPPQPDVNLSIPIDPIEEKPTHVKKTPEPRFDYESFDHVSFFQNIIKNGHLRISKAAESILGSLGDKYGKKVGYILSMCLDDSDPTVGRTLGMENIASLLKFYDGKDAQKSKTYFLKQLSHLVRVKEDGIKAANPLKGASKMYLTGRDWNFYSQGGMLANTWKAFARDWRRNQAAKRRDDGSMFLKYY